MIRGLSHSRLKEIIIAGGGHPLRGKFISEVPAVGLVPKNYICFFSSPATGSTMCMKVKGLTVDAVRTHIAASNAKFGKWNDWLH